MAWPVVLQGWLHTLYLVADAFWVGRLGSTELTALSAVSFGWWILVQVGALAATGVQSKVSHAVGARRPDEVGAWGWHGLVLSCIVAAGLVVSSVAWVPWYVEAMGLTQAAVREDTTRLLTALVVAGAAVAVQQAVEGVFRGLGDTRTALAITGSALILNACLDPILIWGWGPIPALGLAGAAWATTLAASLDVLVGLSVLGWRGQAPTPVALALSRLRTLTWIGLPITLRGVAFSLVYVVLGPMVTAHGDLQLAALGVGHRLEGFTYLAAVGFGTGAGTLVGQHLGAGDLAGARTAAWWSARGAALTMLLGSVLAWVFAAPMYRLFTEDPSIIAAGVVYLRIQACVWVFMGLESVFEGAFAGTGDTRVPLVIGTTLTVARLPLAWCLDTGLGWGVAGIWIAVAASTAAKGALMALWFWREGWVPIARRDGVLTSC